jgi:hypothetical protein
MSLLRWCCYGHYRDSRDVRAGNLATILPACWAACNVTGRVSRQQLDIWQFVAVGLTGRYNMELFVGHWVKTCTKAAASIKIL